MLCQDGDLRLQDGPTELEGRIELCNVETWGTVCDRAFGVSDGNVACRQLGFAPIGTSLPYIHTTNVSIEENLHTYSPQTILNLSSGVGKVIMHGVSVAIKTSR